MIQLKELEIIKCDTREAQRMEGQTDVKSKIEIQMGSFVGRAKILQLLMSSFFNSY